MLTRERCPACPVAGVGFGRRSYLACRAGAVTGGGPRGIICLGQYRAPTPRVAAAPSVIGPGAEKRSNLLKVNPVPLIRLQELMERTKGRPEIVIGLLDGPVAVSHPDLVSANAAVQGRMPYECRRSTSDACSHGTFVAGILVARRGSDAPAICPGCTLLVYPVFLERMRRCADKHSDRGGLGQRDCRDHRRGREGAEFEPRRHVPVSRPTARVASGDGPRRQAGSNRGGGRWQRAIPWRSPDHEPSLGCSCGGI